MAAVSRPALTAATPSLHRVRWSSIRDSFRGRAGEPSIGRNPAKGWLDTPKTLADSSSRRGGHHRWTGPTNRIAAPVRLQPIGRAAGRFATERRDGAERALPLWPGCGRLRRRLRDACFAAEGRCLQNACSRRSIRTRAARPHGKEGSTLRVRQRASRKGPQIDRSSCRRRQRVSRPGTCGLCGRSHVVRKGSQTLA
jgi:hypothetical protein